MRPLKSVLVALCSVLILLISLNDAIAKDNVSQAKEFMQAGMYPQAIAVLEQVIFGDEKAKAKPNPTNAEAQFLLGVCYTNQGRYNNADERFASAVKLKPNYGYKIGQAYKDAGVFSLENGNIGNAETLFQKAVKYQPGLRTAIATDLLKLGKGNNNDQLLSLAVNYNSELRGDVASHYYGLSQSITGEEELNALKKANEYSGGAYRTEVGNKALEACDIKSRPEDRKTCIDRNSDYFDSDQIFESSVRFYTRLLGAPVKNEELDENWKEITSVHPGDRIWYLASNDFEGRNDGGQHKCLASVSEARYLKYDHTDMNDGKTTTVWFKRDKENTNVYVWVERK